MGEDKDIIGILNDEISRLEKKVRSHQKQLQNTEKIKPNIIYNKDHWEAQSKGVVIAFDFTLEGLFDKI